MMARSFCQVLVLSFIFGCDSNGSDECRLLREDSYTASAPAIEMFSNLRVATFELQQEVRTYEEGTCEKPAEGISETRLTIRNLTSCEVSFDYRMSVFEGRVGLTVEGQTFIRQGAASDEGVVLRDLGVRVDRSQILLTMWDFTMESCD